MTDFNQVYKTYFSVVYKYLLSLCRNETLAEELTQETFFKAMDALDSFDGRCKLTVWLCQIAKNSYFDYCRKERRKQPAEGEPRIEPFEERLLQKETAFVLHRALHGLEEPYKEVFSLRVFGELPYGQIAELFGKTESCARVTYHRAKLKLKEDII